jgi:hypothetical protein
VRYAEAQNKNKRVQGSVAPNSRTNDDSAYDGSVLGDVFGSSMDLNRISSHDGLSDLLNVVASNGDDLAAVTALGSSPSHKFADSSVLQNNKAAFGSSALKSETGGLVCVQNLPLSADELFLYKTFSPYGAIISAKIIRNDWNGLCSGVGVVNFRTYSEALTAQLALANARTILNLTVQPQQYGGI